MPPVSHLALWQALGVGPGDVVAFTGGGGKTSLALGAMRELCGLGRRALFATTTKIMTPPCPTVYLPDRPAPDLDPQQALDRYPALVELRRLLSVREPVALTAGPPDPATGKLPGVDPVWIDCLQAWGWADAILVEADGSAKRPLKAPAAYEPVIPASTALVAAVAGATVLGRPLGPEAVHRPELVAALTGLAPGAPITAAAAARALLDPASGCVKGMPAHARAVVAINQADAPGAGSAAGELAAAAVAEGRRHWLRIGSGRVLLTAAQAPAPVLGVRGDVAALLLCAGESRRFGGGHKLLADLAGRLVVQYAAAGLLRSGVRDVLAVTGARAAEVAAALASYPVAIVHNAEFAEGMAASLRRGLTALFPGTPEDPAAFLFCMGDQPLLGPAEVRRLVQAHLDTGAPVVVPVAGGQRRHPVLFARRLVPELLQVRGDQGGRGVLAAHAAEVLEVPFADATPFLDVDTPGEMAEVAAHLARAGRQG